MYSWQRCKLYICFVQRSNDWHRTLQFPLYFLQHCILHIMIMQRSLPGNPWANLTKNVAQTSLIIYNVVKDTKKIATFHAHGHPNVALNTCIIYNVVKNTKDPDNVDLQMVNLLDCTWYKLTHSGCSHQTQGACVHSPHFPILTWVSQWRGTCLVVRISSTRASMLYSYSG